MQLYRVDQPPTPDDMWTARGVLVKMDNFTETRRLTMELGGGLDFPLQAVKFAFQELKLVCEPGGAVALAALLKHSPEWANETIVIVVSGGNIDPEVFGRALQT